MMALLGITQMGYMDPFRARVLQPDPEERYFGRLPADCETGAQLERMPYHNGSVETYSHMKLLCQTPKAPNMMYRVPLTDSQQIGWWLPQDPSETLEKTEPWSRVIRYPLANSEMTQ
ncbi:testis-expressed protein 49-like isoform X3 [Stegostoma tigrinum]|uniref:testis-expressed protein 49-like isoform X3 n=1 Tax=Stegostoma tigrinum TaxID=3053191 RepID=UPI00286FC605|nr:testis-expressed protein 49-like isoform X3 [Stegostoma tigrinum]